MRFYFEKHKIKKYEIYLLRIGIFKIEFMRFKSKFLLRSELNNWDE